MILSILAPLSPYDPDAQDVTQKLLKRQQSTGLVQMNLEEIILQEHYMVEGFPFLLGSYPCCFRQYLEQ
mgnify:CR=1 FL=1